MNGDSDADRDLDRVCANNHRLGDALQNFFRDLCCIFGLMEIRQNDRELVAAVARDRVRLPNTALQALRDLDEQRVGDIVSERVVDRLEAIEVDEKDCQVGAMAFRNHQVHLQALDK